MCWGVSFIYLMYIDMTFKLHHFREDFLDLLIEAFFFIIIVTVQFI